MATSRVLIVNMPFSNLGWPNLGLSLLKAALVNRGIGCDIAYLNFDFAERVGLDHYCWIADYFAFVLGGERLFAKHYFAASPPLPDDHRYFHEVLLPADRGFTEDDYRDYQAIERHVAPFLDACTTAIDWPRYGVVGFAATFQQTMPALCMARRIKEVRPEIKVLFGGAACEGTMGIELARLFPEIDYVFLGEADVTFPSVVQQILEGKPVTLPPGVVKGESPVGNALRGVPGSTADTSSPLHGTPQRAFPTAGLGTAKGSGVFFHVGDKIDPHGKLPPPTWKKTPDPFQPPPAGASEEPTLPPACCELPFLARSDDYTVSNLDELPFPDFDDYFARLKSSPLAGQIEPLLFFETSRGCWWGQKHHCVFCGLNGASMAFRSKTPRRAVEELKWMVHRYGIRRGCASDNILDYRYFDTFLPMLREAQLDLKFVYEMKTNLTRRQADDLLDAGLGAAQLGIETFITPVLKLIGKGANALQNLQALKWFSEAGIEIKWNFLYGFPGEDPADYAAIMELLPCLYHLAPPLAVGRVRLDRFSPYFAEPEGRGMANPRPNRAFSHVYPFPRDVLGRIAYYFEYDYADGRNPIDYVAPVLESLETWQQLQGTVTLRFWDRPDGVLILTDTRPCATAFQRRLSGMEREIYLYCDTGRTFQDIVRQAATPDCQTEMGSSVSNASGSQITQRMLDQWIADRILVRLDGRHLSLAMRARSELDSP